MRYTTLKNLILILLLCPPLWCAPPANPGTDTISSASSRYASGNVRLVFAYWNDDFIFEKELNSLFKRTILTRMDNFLTSNFWLQTDYQFTEEQSISLDLFLNIITFKSLKQRTDMLSSRIDYKHSSARFIVRFGLGYSVTGRFGGSEVQNWYHRLTSIPEVSLPYQYGVYGSFNLLTDLRVNLTNYRSIFITPVMLSSLSLKRFSSFIETGLCINNYYFKSDGLPAILFEIQAGRIEYYNVASVFKELFSGNYYYGCMMTLPLSRNTALAGFVFHNEYGQQNQNHFGITFLFNSKTLKPVSLNNLKFP